MLTNLPQSLSSLLAAAKFTASQTIQNYGYQHFSSVTVDLSDANDLTAVDNIICHSVFGSLLHTVRVVITSSAGNSINMAKLFNSLQSAPSLNILRLETMEDQEMENEDLELPIVAISSLKTLIITNGTTQLDKLITFVSVQPRITMISVKNMCIIDEVFGSGDEPSVTGIWASNIIRKRTGINAIFMDAYSQQIWAPAETSDD